MKIRTDYVSNSSSSSFVLVGKIFDSEKLFDSVKSDELLKKFNKSHDTDYKTFDEALEDDYSVIEFVDILIGNGPLQFETEMSDWDDGDGRIAIGFDPSKMKDSQTLGEFKEAVAKEIEKTGLKAKKSEITFVTGGSDAGGSSWFYDRG